MSSDLLVDLHDELGGDDSPGAALDQLKLVPEKQWPQDDPVSVSKSGECECVGAALTDQMQCIYM